MYNKRSFESSLQHFAIKKEAFEKAIQLTREELTDDYIEQVRQERDKTHKQLEQNRKNKEFADSLDQAKSTQDENHGKLAPDTNRCVDSKPQVTNQQVADQQVANQQVANQQVAKPQVADQQVANQQVAKQQLADQQVANQQVANQQVAKQQVANQQVANHPQKDHLTKSPSESNVKKPVIYASIVED